MNNTKTAADMRWMHVALEQAELAIEKQELPVGSVVVYGNQILGRGHNCVKGLKDPTAHGPLLAITAACSTVETRWLHGCWIYSTLAPCAMCTMAMLWAGVDRIVYAISSEDWGSCSIGALHQYAGYHPEVVGGVNHSKALELFDRYQALRT